MTQKTTLVLETDLDANVLARVSAELCTLSLVPTHLVQDQLSADTLSLTLVLSDASDRSVDLLQRKLMRLPQYIEMRISSDFIPCACFESRLAQEAVQIS